MAGTQLRTMGTTATYAPVIKRGVATMTDGRVVTLSIDTNLAASGGSDVTGVAKFHFYVSTDTTRTAFSLALSYTPVVAPASSTRAARASMSTASDNSIWVAWQGVDNSFNVTRFSYTAGAIAFVANEVINGANAVTDRYRAIDIDMAGPTTPVIACYEASAATGNGAAHRVYVRNNSGTYILAINTTVLATGQFIRTSSEDISVAVRGDGVVSNVIRFVLYGTRTHTTADLGDYLREYSYNVSTGTTGSATNVGTWYATWNQNQAAGTRRGMLFTLSATTYLFAGVIGASVPLFHACKMVSGTYTTPVVNNAGYVSTTALANYFKIDPSANNRTYWSANYKDNRLIFGFAGVGTSSAPRIYREVSMTWVHITAFATRPTIDLVPRPMDSAFYGDGGPIAIYGGDNKRTHAGLNYYNFMAMYGPPATTLSTTTPRRLRFVSEDTFDAPAIVSPYSVEPTNRPTYRMRVENVNLTPNLYGKMEVQIATNSTFTTGVKTILEDDSKLRYFGSKDGLSGGVTQVAVSTPGPTQALTQGTWYWRARLVSDKGTPGAWSGGQAFTVSHPPTANPTFPTPATVIPYRATNNYTFSWTRSDTEPTDTQTAYKIVVRRLDTMASVIDTGFVASGSTSQTITIDAVSLGILEVPLDWSVQLRDADAATGPASTPIQFVIGAVPVVAITSPTPGVPVNTALPSVTWSFTPQGDRVQRAYRVSVYENDTPNVLTNPSFETGDLTGWSFFNSTASASTVQEHSGNYSALVTPTGSGTTARIERTATQPVMAGVSYTVEAWIYPTTAGPQPVVGINWIGPGTTSQITATPIPNTWQKLVLSVEAPLGATAAAVFAGRTGTPAVGDLSYVDDVSFHETGIFTEDPLVTTGWRVGTGTTYTFPSQVLVDQTPYRFVVEVQDTGGLTATDEVAVTTAWTEPALPSGQTVTTPDAFKVRVAWTNAAQDPDFVAYRVYRKYMKTSLTNFDIENTANTWYLLYETSDTSLTNYVYDDYLAPLNRNVQYIVVQVVDRFGSLIESTISSPATVNLAQNRYFFVPEVNIGGIASFEASGVTGDNFTRDVEQEAVHVINRGRQMQIGDDLGYSGTLNIKLRNPDTARRDREFFELISSQYNKVYVKTPFGDVVLIALGNVSTDRQSGYGGYADFADITVPYMQIIDESLVARPMG